MQKLNLKLNVQNFINKINKENGTKLTIEELENQLMGVSIVDNNTGKYISIELVNSIIEEIKKYGYYLNEYWWKDVVEDECYYAESKEEEEVLMLKYINECHISDEGYIYFANKLIENN